MSERTVYDRNDLEMGLCRHIGETVTIFTTSGGASGSGFTGVVLSVDRYHVKLITRIGSAPGYPLGNTFNNYGDYDSMGRGYDPRFRAGSVTIIPLANIAAFVQNAV